MKVKKISKIFCLFSLVCVGSLYAQSSFKELAECALTNNVEVNTALLNYDSALISARTLNGIYAPGLRAGSSTGKDKEEKLFKKSDNMSSNVTYAQPIPGGFTLSTTGSYSFQTYKNYDGTEFVQKTPGVSFTLSNSLFPYWLQGSIHDPSVLSIKQQKEYQYNQLLYTKKQILQNLAQYYVMAIINKKNINVSENSINLIQKQIDALKQLHKAGNTNLARITELENTKWSYQQDLINVLSNYESNVQQLRNICGCDFNIELLDYDIDDSSDVVKFIYDTIENMKDPCEENYLLKLEMLDTKKIAQRQSSAPTVDFTVTPIWQQNRENEKKFDYTNYSVGVGVDFSPLISSLSKNSAKQFSIEYETAEKSYQAYLNQRKFVKQQYSSLLSSYKEQAEMIGDLLEEGEKELIDMKKQFDAGAVSSLDYYSVEIRIKNARLTKQIVELNCWLYEVLLEM